jgi:hypothetical protein
MTQTAWQHVLEMVYPREIPARTQSQGQAAIEALKAFRKQHRHWIRQPNVTGFAIGSKRTAQRNLSRQSLVVMVTEKRPLRHCPHPVPRVLQLPGVGQVETDVQEFPVVEAQSFQHRYRPLRPGASIGFRYSDSGAGTLGCIVRSTRPHESDMRFILSCEHVLYNDLRDRDDINSSTGSIPRTVCQPARNYLAPGEEGHHALLHRAGGVRFDGSSNLIDAAVARLADGIDPGDNAPLPNLPPLGEPMLPTENQRVHLIGATSKKLTGTILHANVGVTINYRGETPGSPLRPANFIGLVSYRCDSSPGDSGGPVVDVDTNRILGIHVAGSGNRAVFCPIHRIFSILELELHTADSPN